MITLPDLTTSLLDFLYEIKDTTIQIIIGGGFGIYLKSEYIRKTDVQTLLTQWPEPRSTNDLDVFLRPEFLIESEKLRPLTEAIEKLGYKVIKGAEKYQFAKPGPDDNVKAGIKIDILTGPQNCFHNTHVRADERRARPKPSIGLHAHPVDEAITLEKNILQVTVDGKLSSGSPWKSDIFLPHPYTSLMMKLFAFRDRANDERKEFGRYHALDLYSILALTTEQEWKQALLLRDQFASEQNVIEAEGIVNQYFSMQTQLGIIRLKENPYYRTEFQLDEFMSALKELYELK